MKNGSIWESEQKNEHGAKAEKWQMLNKKLRAAKCVRACVSVWVHDGNENVPCNQIIAQRTSK